MLCCKEKMRNFLSVPPAISRSSVSHSSVRIAPSEPEMLCSNAPEHHSPSLLLPPAMNFNLVGKASTLFAHRRLRPPSKNASQCSALCPHQQELQNMLGFIDPVVLLQRSEKVLHPWVAAQVLLQADCQVQRSAAHLIHGTKEDLHKKENSSWKVNKEQGKKTAKRQSTHLVWTLVSVLPSHSQTNDFWHSMRSQSSGVHEGHPQGSHHQSGFAIRHWSLGSVIWDQNPAEPTGDLCLRMGGALLPEPHASSLP